MSKLLNVNEKDFKLLIENTASELQMSEAIIEKDFWVCVILKYLFSDFKYNYGISFKGGTSLSKCYNLINRFSEDIDIALDWTLLGYEKEEPYLARSNTKQEQLNKEINEKTVIFLREQWLPIITEHFKKNIKINCEFFMDTIDPQTIFFEYPKFYSDGSILDVIKIEVGCLSEQLPTENILMESYISKKYSKILNDEKFEVTAVMPIRTFYEKLTILHREANRINGNYPERYSRHYYDVYMMIDKYFLDDKIDFDLFKKVINFKKKFYPCQWAKYDEALDGNLKLVPQIAAINAFEKDFKKMKNMINDKEISFVEIINKIKMYEDRINFLLKSV